MTARQQRTETLQDVLARCCARAHGLPDPKPEAKPMPLPVTDDPPPRPWQDQEPTP